MNQNIAYIGVGSNMKGNLSNAEAQVSTAISAIATLPYSQLNQASPYYQSTAIGPDQPDYINAVIEISTLIDPHTLLSYLQTIENRQGRERKERWGPRTLDLDLLFYGGETISTKRLLVPHPEIQNRNFVLAPLADLNAQQNLPFPALAQAIRDCDNSGLQLVNGKIPT